MLAALGCGAPEAASTLPSDDRDAKPPVDMARDLPAVSSETLSDLPPLSSTTLGEHVTAKARTLAAHRYVHPAASLPTALAELDYDGYQRINYRRDAALFRGESPFEVQLLHPGFLYDEPIPVHVVDGAGGAALPFDPDLFDYGDPGARPDEQASEGLGYSGFRILYPVNRSGVADEVAVFQGASYFRVLGPGHAYGLSSRGLGIGIGDEREEFPDFREFWLVRPEDGDESLTFYGLLSSPSVEGAYRFELRVDSATVLEVDAHLFARLDIEKLGVAPMSSMFLYGPGQAGEYDDVRPQVHDSDGLQMWTRYGEWIWRPLANRRTVRVTSLRDGSPRGFGLAQRARDFEDYLDLEAQYHRRPSQWVEAEGDWGVGGVELLELPTESEFADNIAASWVPDVPLRAGEERRFRYRLITFDDRPPPHELARVVRTRVGWDALPGEADPPPRSRRRFVVDFEGGQLPDRDAEVRVVLDATSGTVHEAVARALPSDAGWRVTFALEPDDQRPVDMRLHLAHAGARVSETWSWVWYPDELE